MTDPLGLLGSVGPVGGSPLRPASGAAKGEVPDFRQILMKNIETVNQLQQDAEKAIEDLAAGRRDDVASVMTAKAKSDMAFKMLLQVRNKLMDAYEEVKQIRV